MKLTKKLEERNTRNLIEIFEAIKVLKITLTNGDKDTLIYLVKELVPYYVVQFKEDYGDLLENRG